MHGETVKWTLKSR